MKLNKGYLFGWNMFNAVIHLYVLNHNCLFDCDIWKKTSHIQIYTHNKILTYVKTDYKTGMRVEYNWTWFNLCQKGVAGLLSVAGLFYVAFYIW